MAKEIDVANERHVFRSLLKLAVFLSLIYAAGRFIAQKKDEYSGLTESQARTKFVDKVGPKLGDDTAEEIADQVIPKLKEKGLLKSDASDVAAEAADEAAKDIGDDA